MGYHDLSECTLNDEERRQEAQRICHRLAGNTQGMTEKERIFVVGYFLHPQRQVSVKQLFYLRDLNDKY